MRSAGSVARDWKVAILVPCFNEGSTVGQVVRDFREQLPQAEIYVFDNGSTDETAEEAKKAGAIVREEGRRGKGFVVRSMLRQVEADVYVLVDGDNTYPADRVHALIEPLRQGEADMVVGSRLLESRKGFKLPNLIGNWFFRGVVNVLFRVHVTDLLSGYRALNRAVAKGLPFFGRGFESETELTVKCLERGFRIVEVPITLSSRAPGSRSKIRTVRDGLLILWTMLSLARDYKPLTAFGTVGGLLCLGAVVPGAAVIREYLATGQVLRVPSAILAAALGLAGLVVMFAGLMLHTIARRFQQLDYQLQELLTRQAGSKGGLEPHRIAEDADSARR